MTMTANKTTQTSGITRRHLLQAGLATLAWPLLGRRAAAVEMAPGNLPAADPYQHKNTVAQLPPWHGADHSDSVPGTMMMFRGNASHTYYGAGKLGTDLKLKWRFRMWDFQTTKHGEPYLWQGTGWTGQTLHVGNYVFVGSTGGHFHCFEADTGKLVWVYTAERMFKGSPCFYKNRIYVPNVDNCLRCLDASTGKLLWRWRGPNDMDSSPVVYRGKLYVGGEDGALKCFDPETGKQLWNLPFGVGQGEKPGSGGIESSLAIVDGVGYFGHLDGHIRAVDLDSRKVLWARPIGKDVDASCLVVGDRVWAGVEEGSPSFHCFDRATGKTLWSHDIGGIWSTPAFADGRVFVGTHKGKVHCFDASTGAQVWQYDVGISTWASPAVVDGKVVFGSYDRWLRMLDAADGKLLWKHDLEGRSHSAPAIVNGQIWIGSGSGWYYCFG
jgi:outer membrane protein assembly factor BamB